MRLSKVRGPYSDCGAENPGIKHETSKAVLCYSYSEELATITRKAEHLPA